MQTLEELDVGRGDDLRVAAVPDHADGAVDQIEVVEHLHQKPPRDGMTAAGAEIVVGGLQQVGSEGRDHAGTREVDGRALGH